MYKRLHKTAGGKKTAALTLAALAFLTVKAQAASPAENPGGGGVVTREVVVTASRTEQEVKETPASVEVITREEIETMGAQTVRDALELAV
jgi:outer membrane receptor for ferrienterochelin and colicins